MFRRILCATDGSKRSAHAVKTAAALAHGTGGTLTLVHVTPDYRTPYYPDGVMIDWPSESTPSSTPPLATPTTHVPFW